MKSNYQRTADWLAACGKEPNEANLSVQIGCHIEEFIEFMQTTGVIGVKGREDEIELLSPHMIDLALGVLHEYAADLKKGCLIASIDGRTKALDALCDMDVTGNGIAYLAQFNKEAADAAVLASNDAKLVDGKPVLLPGGKIGKPQGWVSPDLSGFV